MRESGDGGGAQNKETMQVRQWLLTDFRKFTKIIYLMSKACLELLMRE